MTSSIRKKPENKSISVNMDFPVHMDDDKIHLYRKEVAEFVGDMLVREIYEQNGPNWFETLSGWIPQPGIYRVTVTFSINKELIGGPYSAT